jgi:U3 small nucleolar RNA-associated protein 21
MHKVIEFVGHKNKIIKFITAGEFIFSLAEEGEFIVFNRQKGTIVKQMKFETSFDNLVHPNTYVNKLLFSCSENSSTGSCLELWNIMSCERVFEFPRFKNKGVSCIEQSPVVDVVAVGCTNGEIHIVNLLYDEELVHFTHKSSDGKIKSMSFSSDLTLGVSLLASIAESPVEG